MMSIAVPIASHLPHAVGHAYAARLAGRDVVTVAYFGDGATSETDFHSGLNFAGVWRTPTVFFCQNNLYAISVPYEKQTASPTIAAEGRRLRDARGAGRRDGRRSPCTPPPGRRWSGPPPVRARP